MAVVSALVALSVDASSVLAVTVALTFLTLSSDTGLGVSAVAVASAVNAHVLIAADLAVVAVAVVVAADADVLGANAAVVAVQVVGTFDALFVVTDSVAVVIRIAEVWFDLVTARTSSDRDDFGLDGSERSEFGGEVDPSVGEILQGRKRNSVLVGTNVDRPHGGMGPLVELNPDTEFDVE